MTDTATISTPDAPPAYWECDVVLADGGTVHVRPLGPDDADRLVAFHAGLSDETVYLRFFSPKPTLSRRGGRAVHPRRPPRPGRAGGGARRPARRRRPLRP